MSNTARWTKVFSESKGRFYYFDAVSGESIWTVPNGFIEAEADNSSQKRKSDDLSGCKEQDNTKRSRNSDLDHAISSPISRNSSSSSSITVTTRPVPEIRQTHPHSSESKWKRADLQVNPELQRIYSLNKVYDAVGNPMEFIDCVDPHEGRHLYDIINDNNMTSTLEIGLAMGASTCWICQALSSVKSRQPHLSVQHIAIDPNQTSQYKSIGLLNVSRCGLSNHLTHLAMTSYQALPMLLKEVNDGSRDKFDLIFIDGWHTFDYTLVDAFYADLLLKVNGVIVVDDIRHKPVQACIQYLASNYKHWRYLNSTPCSETTATFIKTGPDERRWNEHVDF